MDRPASTLTMNSGVISSDMKGHPVQNRVLSLREILILSTFDQGLNSVYPWHGKYSFGSYSKNTAENKVIRQVVGESIPPLAACMIVRRLMEIDHRINFELPELEIAKEKESSPIGQVNLTLS